LSATKVDKVNVGLHANFLLS